MIGRGNAGNCMSLGGIIDGWRRRQKSGSLRQRISLRISAASVVSLVIGFIAMDLVHRYRVPNVEVGEVDAEEETIASSSA